MKNATLKISFCLTAILALSSCKKEIAQTQKKQEYIQHFNATVAGKSVRIQNSLNKDRIQFNGSWTGVGMGNGTQLEMYTVRVTLPKEVLGRADESKLRFQIFDIQRKEYQINGDKLYEKDFSTHIYLQNSVGKSNDVIYTTSSLKKPFKIEITKYELPKGSLVPIVGGKLNGVLYNTKDLTDSILIHDGDFEVRF